MLQFRHRHRRHLMKDEVIKIFCETDDFYQQFEKLQRAHLIESGKPLPKRVPGLCMSEMMTIMIWFHQGRFRNFKGYYQDYICIHWKNDFPGLVSYNRFVELMGRMLIPLTAFQLSCKQGAVTGISFIDASALHVCRNQRIHNHKVFDGFAERGKTSMGWFYGFKLHLIVNERGEIVAWALTTGNVSDKNQKLCKKLTQKLWGKLFGDKGYISKPLFDTLMAHGVKLITKLMKNMKNKLMDSTEKLLLRKRAIIETIFDQLKNISQIEHSRHRSPLNFLVNLVAGLLAYCFAQKKPSIYGVGVENYSPYSEDYIPN